MSMLEVKDLQVYYGVIQALKGISFHVEQWIFPHRFHRSARESLLAGLQDLHCPEL